MTAATSTTLSPTKVCIVGAGAIGGFVGARLAKAGHVAVSALARGATLEALRRHGWRVRSPSVGDIQTPVVASDHAADLGTQDLVVIALKGPALADVAPRLAPLLGPGTLVLPAMNGVPWWFCRGVDGFDDDASLRSVDPDGRIARALPFERVLGCVVHMSANVPEPGLVQHTMGQGLIVGEARGGRSERAQGVVDLLSRACFDTTHADNVRRDIWFKLWGNLTMNPITAITGATMDRVLADPLLREFCSAVMREAAAIGARIGCPITQSPEDRHAITARLGAVRTSMLQDVQANRPIELDALVTAVHEIGERLGEPMPNIGALLGMARLFGRVRGLYGE